ncbi:hypothetical protein [Streptomyces tuirus]|uniref:Uncharacterized protein n=1 Tax=Streptomyces tuirus TaxID=68278 RepID=A0A7G1NJF2_9ACTN|nr:hypothetical protein [Streptomyces tuirus]BCL23288.1 hypothetical protein GCM10017668_51310 [Streptomyces tuirus]
MTIPPQRTGITQTGPAVPTPFNADALKASLAGAGAGVGLAAFVGESYQDEIAGKVFLYLAPLIAVLLSAFFEWILVNLELVSRRKKARIRYASVQAMLNVQNLDPARKAELDQEQIEIENEALRWGFPLT